MMQTYLFIGGPLNGKFMMLPDDLPEYQVHHASSDVVVYTDEIPLGSEAPVFEIATYRREGDHYVLSKTRKAGEDTPALPDFK